MERLTALVYTTAATDMLQVTFLLVGFKFVSVSIAVISSPTWGVPEKVIAPETSCSRSGVESADPSAENAVNPELTPTICWAFLKISLSLEVPKWRIHC